ncbi:YidB family protein [Polynucleobacter rarus]|uniref:YidB family protein n=1 Tax=Polynucleobacter rarus TaxID=556055 RepID=UPI000D3EBCFB|nr:YidB family protein [Polynucleobacter rarus]
MNVMGILGALLGNKSQSNQEASPMLMNVLTAFLSNPNSQANTQTNEPNLVNGIGTLVNMFEQSGLSSHVQSWVGTGANQPIEASDIMKVLGNTKVAELAQQLGVNPELASQQIAHFLPTLIDSFTPNGELPQNAEQLSSIATQLLGSLKKA